jgi:hypothetical protein
MPYVISTSVDDDRSVSMAFDPDIPMDYMRKLIGVFPMTADERAAIPTRLRVGKPRVGGIPHILGWMKGPFIVSWRVRGLIEELEPGVQEFSPIELVGKDGGRGLGTYFLILHPPKLDAVIKEQTEFVSPTLLRPFDRCVLDAAVIRGHHFWRGEEPLILTYFCSDELGGRLKKENLDGWDLRHRCTVQQR